MKEDAGLHVPSGSDRQVRASASWTVVKWLVIITIIGLFFVVLSPLLLRSREAARRAMCLDKLKHIGVALHNFHDLQGEFPTNEWSDRTGHGWSWLTYLLPYLEEEALFDSLDIQQNRPDGTGRGALYAQRARPAAFVCPSNSGARWCDDTTPGRETGGISNYKSMGATTVESLMCYDTTTAPEPPYATVASHPDGGMSYGKRLAMRDFSDGTSHTVIAAETIEGTPTSPWDTRAAAWHIGQTATLVGFQTASLVPPEVGYNYYRFPGYLYGQYDPESDIPDSAAVTYLRWDYATSPYAGGYGDNQATYGLSSNHPGVVNHLYADGAARSISTDEDRSSYFFSLTRSNGDPNGFDPAY